MDTICCVRWYLWYSREMSIWSSSHCSIPFSVIIVVLLRRNKIFEFTLFYWFIFFLKIKQLLFLWCLDINIRIGNVIFRFFEQTFFHYLILLFWLKKSNIVVIVHSVIANTISMIIIFSLRNIYQFISLKYFWNIISNSISIFIHWLLSWNSSILWGCHLQQRKLLIIENNCIWTILNIFLILPSFIITLSC